MKQPISNPLLDYFFEKKKIDSLIEFLTGKTNNRKEVNKNLANLNIKDPISMLFVRIIEKNFPLTKRNLSSFFDANNKLEKQCKIVFMNKVRTDLLALHSLILLCTRFGASKNLFDTVVSATISILEILSVYYVLLPIFLDYVIKTDLIDSYIQENISYYNKSLSSISYQRLLDRFAELNQDEYKYLFTQINRATYHKNIPSLKHLTAFYIKNNTDINVSYAAIPEEMKACIINIENEIGLHLV